MLQPAFRVQPLPAILAIGPLGHWSEHEPGRLTAEQAAAEANALKPMGAAQATMEKINAMAASAEAKATPRPEPRGQRLDLRA